MENNTEDNKKYSIEDLKSVGKQILNLVHLDLRTDDKFIYKIAMRDIFSYGEALNLKNSGYDEMWYLYDKKMISTIICASKNGVVEVYKDLYVQLINAGRNEKYVLKEQLPVILDVDIILEKIHVYGMDAITKEEKDFLDKSY